MSEIKFACPVCGQHITTDVNTAGGRIECPTCFRNIVVPDRGAPTDSKLVLAASTESPPKPHSHPEFSAPARPRPPRSRRLGKTVLVVTLLFVTAIMFFTFHDEVIGAIRAKWNQWRSALEGPKSKPSPLAGMTPKAVSGWTLDVSMSLFPDEDVRGRIHGRPFRADRATLHGGQLSFKQGESWPPQLGIDIHLFAQDPTNLAGKVIEIPSDRHPPLPLVVLRWIDEDGRPETEQITSGYASRIVFGKPVQGRIQGKFYIALPDAVKSYAAGDFDAKIIRPSKGNSSAPGASGIPVAP
jgi:hypothetical protein